MKLRDLIEERAKFGFGPEAKSIDLPKKEKKEEGEKKMLKFKKPKSPKKFFPKEPA